MINETIRTLGDELITTQNKVVDWQIDSIAHAEKQLIASMETLRASMELGRDTTARLTQTTLDFVAPRKGS